MVLKSEEKGGRSKGGIQGYTHLQLSSEGLRRGRRVGSGGGLKTFPAIDLISRSPEAARQVFPWEPLCVYACIPSRTNRLMYSTLVQNHVQECMYLCARIELSPLPPPAEGISIIKTKKPTPPSTASSRLLIQCYPLQPAPPNPILQDAYLAPTAFTLPPFIKIPSVAMK